MIFLCLIGLFLINKKKIGKRIIIRPIFILSNFSRKSLGIKWIIEAALNRTGSFYDNLALEILEAFHNKGSVKKKQKDLIGVVLENRSNLKYRWK